LNNQGGYKYVTSKTTLSNPVEPVSMLSAMFSGRFGFFNDFFTPILTALQRYALEKDDEGHFFIDRDGRRFHYILNYLRDPTTFVVPEDPQVHNLYIPQITANHLNSQIFLRLKENFKLRPTFTD
jgi:hypothetical protein